jgi:hypothetical protein
MTGDDHQYQGAEEFLLVEMAAALVMGGDQGAGEIVAGMLGPGGHHGAQHPRQFPVRGGGLLGPDARGRHLVRQLVRPVAVRSGVPPLTVR